MRNLIFLLFFVFALSNTIKKGLINRNECIGGEIKNGKCKCPSNTALIGYECKPCINGSIIDGRCKYFQGNIVIRNNSIVLKTCPRGYLRINGKCVFLGAKIFKPVIYLYPEKIMDISVQLNIKNSEFTTIYPKFNGKNTWNVRAKPNGDILLKGRTYPYLFWEADSYNQQETNEGFIVTEENAEQFLEEKLKILGLNEKEKTDFITFWLPKLLRNKISLCSFQTKKFFEDFELNVTPKPDSMLRIFLTIKKLDRPINIKEQKLVSVERKGFTVIEWGGSNL